MGDRCYRGRVLFKCCDGCSYREEHFFNTTTGECVERLPELPDPTGTGYLFATSRNSNLYLDGLVHVERDDQLKIYVTDEDASIAAEADGIAFLHHMPGIPDRTYLDIPSNWAILRALNFVS